MKAREGTNTTRYRWHARLALEFLWPLREFKKGIGPMKGIYPHIRVVRGDIPPYPGW
jgi:hypothetical protein